MPSSRSTPCGTEVACGARSRAAAGGWRMGTSSGKAGCAAASTSCSMAQSTAHGATRPATCPATNLVTNLATNPVTHPVTHPVTSRCDEPVDGGLRALGRAWHDACLTCQHSGEALGEGDFYLHEGAPLSGAALRHTAPLCASCGEPALKARLYRHPPYSPWLHSPRLYLLWVHSLWPHLP